MTAAAAASWFLTAEFDAPGIRSLGFYRERWLLLNLALSYVAVWAIIWSVRPPRRKTLFGLVAAHCTVGALVVVLELCAVVGLVDFQTLIEGRKLDPDPELGLRRKGEPNRSWEGNPLHDLCVRLGVSGERVPVKMRFDEYGLRNPAGKTDPQVFVLGDSLIYGVPAAPEDLVSEQLQRQLDGVQVLAVAEANYAPQESLRRLAGIGLPVEGRVVVHVLFEGNDLWDSRAWRDWQSGSMASGWPQTGLVKNLLGLAKMPNAGVAERRFGWVTPTGGERKKVYFLYDGMRLRQTMGEFPEVARVLAEANQQFAAQGAKYIVALIPSKLRALSTHAEWPDDCDIAAPEMHDSPFADALLELCAREAIPFVDTTAALRATLDAGEFPFYPLDTHLAAPGHGAVAAAILPLVKKARESLDEEESGRRR